MSQFIRSASHISPGSFISCARYTSDANTNVVLNKLLTGNQIGVTSAPILSVICGDLNSTPSSLVLDVIKTVACLQDTLHVIYDPTHNTNNISYNNTSNTTDNNNNNDTVTYHLRHNIHTYGRAGNTLSCREYPQKLDFFLSKCTIPYADIIACTKLITHTQKHEHTRKYVWSVYDTHVRTDSFIIKKTGKRCSISDHDGVSIEFRLMCLKPITTHTKTRRRTRKRRKNEIKSRIISASPSAITYTPVAYTVSSTQKTTQYEKPNSNTYL